MTLGELPVSDSGHTVGWQNRTTNSPTFTGSATKILSARAPIILGRSYLVVVNGEVEMTTAVSGVATQHEIRVTSDDTEPTTSSTQIGRTVLPQDPGGLPTGVQVLATYDATTSGFLRAAVVSSRPVGSTTCEWTAAAGRPMSIYIIDIGPTIAADGVVS